MSRFIFALVMVWLLLSLSVIFIINIADWHVAIPVALLFAIAACISWPVLSSLVVSVIDGNHMHTIEISKDTIILVQRGESCGVSLRDQSITKGYFGINIITNPSGQALLIPEAVVSHTLLRQRIQAAKNKTPMIVAIGRKSEAVLRLNFTLDKRQRLFGCPSVFLYTLALAITVAAIPLFLVGIIFFPFSIICLLVFVALFFGMLLFGPFFYVVNTLNNQPYTNRVEVGERSLWFGRSGIEVELPKTSFSAHKGCFDTSVLRSTTGTMILVPVNAISFHDLKNAVEGK